jgi:phosphatidate cytidylyltransferase
MTEDGQTAQTRELVPEAGTQTAGFIHLKRWLTALVCGPVIIGVILSGSSLIFFITIIVVGLLGQQEYLDLAFSKKGDRTARVLGGILGIAVMIVPMTNSTGFAWPVFAGMTLITFSFFLFRADDIRESFEKSGKFLLGLFYIPFFLSFFGLIWQEKHAAQWIIFGLGVVLLGDTGAFYAGRWWGRHKLYPRVSPAKTVEGSMGGLTLSLVFALGFSAVWMPFLSVQASLLLAAALNILGQLGDLFESSLKRSAGAKDSGNCLPGHGGIMDRIDGVLFSAPALYGYIKYLY